MLSFVIASSAQPTTRMFTAAGPQQWHCANCAQWVGVPTVNASLRGVPIQVCQYCVDSCR